MISINCFSQVNKSSQALKKKYSCIINNKIKNRASRNTYPFNIADRILLVSYKAPRKIEYGKINVEIFSWDTVSAIPIKISKVDTTMFIEKVRLSSNGIDSLLYIMNCVPSFQAALEYNFIEPSNAIVFIDKDNNVFDFLVVCFYEQQGELIVSERPNRKSKLTLGDWCMEKGLMVKNLFLSRGVNVVITKY